MDTLFHFVFSVMAGMAVFREKHRIPAVLTLAFLSVLVDLDHFFGMSARGTFHNIFIVIGIPVTAFVMFYFYERKKSIKLQTYALTLMVMLAGHVAADTFYGGEVKLLYPLSSQEFVSPSTLVLATDQFYSPIISRDGMSLTVYSIILMLVFFVDDFIYFFENKHQKIKKALESVKNDLF